MSNTIRWGILGTGYIAREFAKGLKSLPDAELVAVGSRSLANAQNFASDFKVSKAYQGYEELVKDPNVDIFYIATPNHRHSQDALLCLEANKPILCEKPFALNAGEAQAVIDLARRKQLFCMEAMWMRFIPAIAKVKKMVDNGVIGELLTITADFGISVPYDPNNRFFNPELGGGSLLDLGVYGISLAFYLLGSPSSIVSQASLTSSGVDEQSSVILSYSQGKLAILSTHLRAYTSNEAVAIGTKGAIRIHEPFCRPHKISLRQFPETVALLTSSNSVSGIKSKLISYLKDSSFLKRLYFQFDYLVPLIRRKWTPMVQPYQGNGYNYEAAEVMKCLRAKKLESSVMPLEETLSIMKTIDAIRQQWSNAYIK
jgi:predicted dehydrogenase